MCGGTRCICDAVRLRHTKVSSSDFSKYLLPGTGREGAREGKRKDGKMPYFLPIDFTAEILLNSPRTEVTACNQAGGRRPLTRYFLHATCAGQFVFGAEPRIGSLGTAPAIRTSDENMTKF